MRLHHLTKHKQLLQSPGKHTHRPFINLRSRSLASERSKREGGSLTLYEKFMSQEQKKNQHLLNSKYKLEEESFSDIREKPLVHTSNLRSTTLDELSAPKLSQCFHSKKHELQSVEISSFAPEISRLENLSVVEPYDRSIHKSINRIRKAHEV